MSRSDHYYFSTIDFSPFESTHLGFFFAKDGPLTRTQLEHNLPNSRTRPNILKDVLQLLVTLGVVQKVLGETDKYCVLRGIPRTDVILPRDVLGEVESATTQWKSSLKRAQILKEALLKNKDGNAKEVLSNILREFPEIMHDPVYVAALRNMQVDIAAVEKERIKR